MAGRADCPSRFDPVQYSEDIGLVDFCNRFSGPMRLEHAAQKAFGFLRSAGAVVAFAMQFDEMRHYT